MARRPSARIFAIKLVHSAIYLFMSTCLAWLYWAAATATFDWRLAVAVGAVAGEAVVLLLNGRRCPLTTLAQRLGDETGDDLIADRLLPRWAVRRTVPFCSLVFAGGLALLLASFLRVVAGGTP